MIQSNNRLSQQWTTGFCPLQPIAFRLTIVDSSEALVYLLMVFSQGQKPFVYYCDKTFTFASS